MAPTAVEVPAVPLATTRKIAVAVPPSGPSLAIGSLTTAQDGKYQALVTSLEHKGNVERQMLDRLVDGGA
jgi:hypothetical protein